MTAGAKNTLEGARMTTEPMMSQTRGLTIKTPGVMFLVVILLVAFTEKLNGINIRSIHHKSSLIRFRGRRLDTVREYGSSTHRMDTSTMLYSNSRGGTYSPGTNNNTMGGLNNRNGAVFTGSSNTPSIWGGGAGGGGRGRGNQADNVEVSVVSSSESSDQGRMDGTSTSSRGIENLPTNSQTMSSPSASSSASSSSSMPPSTLASTPSTVSSNFTTVNIPPPLNNLVDVNIEAAAVVYEVTLGRELGIEIVQGDGFAYVGHVIPHSKAESLGIQKGDHVVAISATAGDQMWTHNSLESVKSTLSTRFVMSSTVRLRFERPLAAIPLEIRKHLQIPYVITMQLKRPIGLHVVEGMFIFLFICMLYIYKDMFMCVYICDI